MHQSKLEQYLVAHCSPTLAGIKTANLFSCLKKDMPHLERELQLWRGQLSQKGIALEVLCECPRRTLIYIYCPHRLQQDLAHPTARKVLSLCGYQGQTTQELLDTLRRRIGDGAAFPHEIGLFLGYPPEDVLGFIENEGRNYKLCGYWKVYTNVERAQHLFQQYTHCRSMFCIQTANGVPVMQLIRAA